MYVLVGYTSPSFLQCVHGMPKAMADTAVYAQTTGGVRIRLHGLLNPQIQDPFSLRW